MSTGYLELEFKRGSNWKKTFTWKVKATGVAVDLTGYTAKMQLRKGPDGDASNTTLYATYTNSDFLTLGGVQGSVSLNVPAATTAAYTFKRAFYDLLLTSAGSEKTYLIEGIINVKARTTT